MLLPILGDHYGRVLEAGELVLVRRGGRFEIHYHEHRMPVAPRSLDALTAEAARRCGSPDLAFISDSFELLPPATATDRESITRRHRDKEVLAGQLARLAEERPEVAQALDEAVAAVNADPDRLDALLQRQNYRVAFWRTAGQELDYRRFFDVHTLIGLRMEDERVFADTHALVLRWLREGVLDGVRIDHPDGLRDPEEYLERLRDEAPEAWIVVEKILARDEPLRDSWPIEGTTGYDFLARAGALLVDPAGERPLTDLYAELTGESADWPAMVREKKLFILGDLLASDVNRLAEAFLEVCERHRRHRDYTRFELRQAIREVAACFPVYRTYVRAEIGEVTDLDQGYVDAAIEAARAARPDLSAELFDFFRDLLLLAARGEPESELVMRFQQLTGPAMAKGVEDTAFYNFHRLVALNEVGGSPGDFGLTLEEFHRAGAEAAERWPTAMLATSTHDTKRSEDVRARISLLAEIPERWAEAVRRWVRAQRPAQAGTLPGPQRRIPALSDAGRRLADHPRAGGPVHGEGGAGGQGPHLVDPDRRRVRGGPAGVRRRGAGRRRIHRRPRRLRGAAGRAGESQFPRADPAQARRPRRAGLLSGERALGPLAGRPRQPPAGGLRPAAPPSRRAEGGNARGGDPRPGGRRPAEALADPSGAPPAPAPAGGLWIVWRQWRLRAPAGFRAAGWITSSPSCAAARWRRSRRGGRCASPATGRGRRSSCRPAAGATS